MKRKGVSLLLLLMLLTTLLSGCGNSKKKREKAREDYAFCEHIVSISSLVQAGEVPETVLDSEGFYAVRENIYVRGDSGNIREKANTESKLIAIAPYGTRLVRTGIGTNGWDRVEYEDRICFISHDLVTTVPIKTGKSFDYSVAAMSIVETRHQQYSYDDLCTDLNELRENYGSKMHLNCIGVSADNRSIFEIVIGTDNAKKDIYFIAGVCGAEYMTSLVIMKQVEYFLHYYDAGDYEGYSYADLFDSVRVHVVPMLNPDGVNLAQHFFSGIHDEDIKRRIKDWYDRDQSAGGINLNLDNYLRFFFANAKGTDLRKNFPYQWDLVSTTAFPASNGYRGDYGGSEAEVRSIVHALKTVKPELVVTYHTTGSRLFYNFGQPDEILSVARNYGLYLGKLMTYEASEKKLIEDGYGTLSGYCNNILQIPALTVNLGNGAAPLALSEFNAIWNATRESWSALQVKMIDW